MPGKNVHLSRSAFDKALEFKASKYYRLSIQLSQDGFSFCIYDNSRDKYSGIASWDFQEISNSYALHQLLKDFLPQNEWLSQTFEKTSIIFETPVSTLVPKALFTNEHAGDYLKFNHHLDQSLKINSDYLPLLEAENIWAIPQNISDLLSGVFPSAKIYHHSSSLIETILFQNKNKGADESVFVNVRKNWFDIVILKGNHLLLFNSFKYRTREDFIYFLIYVLEQLNLNPEEIDVTLMGEILKISSVYEITYKYVRNISFVRRHNNYQFSYIFDDFPEHFYFNLINLQQCGL
ncbi:MAG: DUF3822 family protein [Bacteroidales bacterium]|nr:DUF3822 family protein [Bacteroidales bacterium]